MKSLHVGIARCQLHHSISLLLTLILSFALDSCNDRVSYSYCDITILATHLCARYIPTKSSLKKGGRVSNTLVATV